MIIIIKRSYNCSVLYHNVIVTFTMNIAWFLMSLKYQPAWLPTDFGVLTLALNVPSIGRSIFFEFPLPGRLSNFLSKADIPSRVAPAMYFASASTSSNLRRETLYMFYMAKCSVNIYKWYSKYVLITCLAVTLHTLCWKLRRTHKWVILIYIANQIDLFAFTKI